MRTRLIQAITLMATLLLITGVAQASPGPRELIVHAVNQITQRIDQERQHLKNDPQYAQKVVRQELKGLVDFKRITRLVMANHFSQASRDQKYHFLNVFRDSLITTYASGITLYDDQGIKVLPMRDNDIRGNLARVRMQIHTRGGRSIPIDYTLFKDQSGDWKVQNVIVNGLNLGKTFRAQFDQLMQQYNGDVDKVIANWSSQLDVNGNKPGSQPTGASDNGKSGAGQG